MLLVGNWQTSNKKRAAKLAALFYIESNFLDYFTNLKDSSEPSIDTLAM